MFLDGWFEVLVSVFSGGLGGCLVATTFSEKKRKRHCEGSGGDEYGVLWQRRRRKLWYELKWVIFLTRSQIKWVGLMDEKNI